LPARFLHVAEDLGLIEQIGDWVLRDALAQLRVWRAARLGTFRVAVNISPRQLSGVSFVQRLRAHLEWSGVPPELLELEITEGAVIHDPQGVADILAQCHAMGIKLAMDDFGTGYSSLSYLKRFPIDFLKIDKSFVDGLPSDPNDRALVNAIIAMAHNLDIRVVGEGVETEAQRAYLAAQQCYELQGYFFAPPSPAAALEPILRTGFGGAWLLRSNPVPAEA
jgi:EAL domain-containing protein (putative c-di-GMP-specific phosphodiesterase class I)